VTVADRLAIELKYSRTKEFEFSAIERRCKHHAFIGTMMRTYCARTSACFDILPAALADGNVRRELILCHCKLTPCRIPEHENLIHTIASRCSGGSSQSRRFITVDSGCWGWERCATKPISNGREQWLHWNSGRSGIERRKSIGVWRHDERGDESTSSRQYVSQRWCQHRHLHHVVGPPLASVCKISSPR
jgi:hypothetical protein